MSDPKPPTSSEIDDLFGFITKLENRVDILTARVHMLEIGAGPMRNTDELADKILEFLKCHKGIKFNTGTVAANISEKSERVSAKLRALASHDILKTDKVEGHSQMFWYIENITEGGTNEQVQ